jgi:endoglucanase
MHTPVEMCDLRDVEAAIKLIVETVAALKPDDKFIPGVS